ncbi:GntR family transcriptional regulator [Chitinimonas sp. BJYL2]|uniref:GntR family transcriptional regulator n=1 Tax=Chitinimonas sp. BJYL2 TaxID=2976696 RepID=UPI0022B40F8F|nr:GntR family transcriptional regulator [Chitinimonas sp. BJYL2]
MKSANGITIQDRTYQTLRQWVTVGRFLPGERLKINTLALEMGVSDMPVRAALQRLAAEGALVNVPNCGVMVPKLSRAQFDDILQNRLLLEGEAAERGARQLDATERAQLLTLGKDMARAIAAGDLKGYLDANELFHLILYRACGSALLLELIETVWLKVGPISNRLHDDPHVWATMNDAHDELLAALARKDAPAVRRAIEKDLFCAGQYLRTLCTE